MFGQGGQKFHFRTSFCSLIVRRDKACVVLSGFFRVHPCAETRHALSLRHPAALILFTTIRLSLAPFTHATYFCGGMFVNNSLLMQKHGHPNTHHSILTTHYGKTNHFFPSPDHFADRGGPVFCSTQIHTRARRLQRHHPNYRTTY